MIASGGQAQSVGQLTMHVEWRGLQPAVRANMSLAAKRCSQAVADTSTRLRPVGSLLRCVRGREGGLAARQEPEYVVDGRERKQPPRRRGLCDCHHLPTLLM